MAGLIRMSFSISTDEYLRAGETSILGFHNASRSCLLGQVHDRRTPRSEIMIDFHERSLELARGLFILGKFSGKMFYL